ncbi:MAG: CDP-paratose 2-epimerase [Hyphomicrobiales bacterium]|nr:CDP-paratose 2-epimerase [Hyphomicrobiales bacterium]
MTRPSAYPDLSDDRPVLVTGGAGFIGSNLVDRLAREGQHVHIYDCLARAGVERNLAWLQARHPGAVHFTRADMREREALTAAAKGAKAVFHLAAQVAVTTSLIDPREDFLVNVQGTFDLVDALRSNPVPLIMASTNKVYGDLADVALEISGEQYLPRDATLRARGVDETRSLDFHTPYGCSKGAADQYVLDASRSFGIPSGVLRMSCIYGPRQMGTEDQGWVAHFVLRALSGQPITIYGDGRQVRDIMCVHDAVDAYLALWAQISHVQGRAFNLGGGPSNAVSLIQLLDHIESLIGKRIVLRHDEWRAGDQRYFVSDTSRVRRELALRTPIGWREGVAELTRWLMKDRAPRRGAAGAEVLS